MATQCNTTTVSPLTPRWASEMYPKVLRFDPQFESLRMALTIGIDNLPPLSREQFLAALPRMAFEGNGPFLTPVPIPDADSDKAVFNSKLTNQSFITQVQPRPRKTETPEGLLAFNTYNTARDQAYTRDQVFAVFNSVDDYIKWSESDDAKGKLHLNECMRGFPQCFRMDIDIVRAKCESVYAKLPSDKQKGPDSVYTTIIQAAETLIHTRYGFIVPHENWVEDHSSNSVKYSRHAVLRGFHFTHGFEMEAFVQDLTDFIHRIDPLIVENGFFDPAPSRSSQGLRIRGNSKLTSPDRVKIPVPGSTPHTLKESLSSYVDLEHSKVLHGGYGDQPEEHIISSPIMPEYFEKICHTMAMLGITGIDCSDMTPKPSGSITLPRIAEGYCPCHQRNHTNYGFEIYRDGGDIILRCQHWEPCKLIRLMQVSDTSWLEEAKIQIEKHKKYDFYLDTIFSDRNTRRMKNSATLIALDVACMVLSKAHHESELAIKALFGPISQKCDDPEMLKDFREVEWELRVINVDMMTEWARCGEEEKDLQSETGAPEVIPLMRIYSDDDPQLQYLIESAIEELDRYPIELRRYVCNTMRVMRNARIEGQKIEEQEKFLPTAVEELRLKRIDAFLDLPKNPEIKELLISAIEVLKCKLRSEEIPTLPNATHISFQTMDHMMNLPPHLADRSASTVMVLSPMGTSKSILLRKHIKFSPLYTRVIFITGRRALTRETLAKVELTIGGTRPFESYMDLGQGQIYIDGCPEKEKSGHPRLLIQLESLWRVTNYTHIDLVVLDEPELIFGQPDNPSLRGQAKHNSMAKLKDLLSIKTTSKVILLDALLGARSLETIQEFRGESPIYSLVNDFPSWRTKKFIFVSYDLMLLKIEKAISRGENICFATSCRRAQESLMRYLKDAHPEAYKSSVAISALSSKEVRDTFSDVNKAWSECRLLTWTGTVVAGVSFERKHYNRLFAYFVAESMEMRLCVQLIGRVRDISTGKYYISFPKSTAKQGMACTKADVESAILEAYGNALTPITEDLKDRPTQCYFLYKTDKLLHLKKYLASSFPNLKGNILTEVTQGKVTLSPSSALNITIRNIIQRARSYNNPVGIFIDLIHSQGVNNFKVSWGGKAPKYLNAVGKQMGQLVWH